MRAEFINIPWGIVLGNEGETKLLNEGSVRPQPDVWIEVKPDHASDWPGTLARVVSLYWDDWTLKTCTAYCITKKAHLQGNVWPDGRFQIPPHQHEQWVRFEAKTRFDRLV